MVRSLIFFALLAASGCQTGPVGWTAGSPLTGSWGGNHVGLTLSPVGGMLEYDCASGDVSTPLIPDRAGNFAATGFHTPGHGGPDRIDYVPPRKRATYTGRVTGDRMTLTVRVEDGLLIGPLSLIRGAEPRVFRCL